MLAALGLGSHFPMSEDRAITHVDIATAYDEHHERVRAFARRLVGEESAAEDLVQETFISLPAALPRLRAEGTVRSLLLGICANHAKHHVRAAARRRNKLEHYRQSSLLNESSGPEGDVRRSQLRERLQVALDALSHEHRVVIVLCAVEERSSSEAAEILAIPEATVRTRLFHARRKLREAFGEEEAS